MQMHFVLQPLAALIAEILILMIPRLLKLYRRHLIHCDRHLGVSANVTGWLKVFAKSESYFAERRTCLC